MKTMWTWLTVLAMVALLGCSSGTEKPTAKDQPDADTAKPGEADAQEGSRLEKYEAAMRRGADWILSRQREDGSFAPAAEGAKSADVGLTALGLTAVLSTPQADEFRKRPEVERAANFLASSAQPDGSINPSGVRGLANYQTAAALTALSLYDDPDHAEVRKDAKEFLLSIQNTEGLDTGSWGYNSSQRGDVSNTQFALEALKAAGLDEDSEAFQNCVTFLQRCQNRSESNDQPWAGNDGGGIYYPSSSKAGVIELPDGKKLYKSYGSMTYALLRGYVLAGLEIDDPRVQAAQKWIAEHYTLSKNPGMPDERKLQGLYYYYLSMAKALSLYGTPVIEAPDGTTLHWARDLGDKLVDLQEPQGSWVNEAMRWMENDRLLATSYALIALSECHEALAASQ
ncbi:MAG: prenyltransferase/squalene oxidase repeat-containing protein [Planctomycetota bacterium]